VTTLAAPRCSVMNVQTRRVGRERRACLAVCSSLNKVSERARRRSAQISLDAGWSVAGTPGRRPVVCSPGGRPPVVDDAVPSWAHRCKKRFHVLYFILGCLGSRVVSVLDSGTDGPGFKSQLRRCRVTVLGKLFTPVVPLFTKQPNW